MTTQTNIEWADSTFNPWTGCTKVSLACDHCYAESWSKRAGPKVGKWGPGAPRVRTSPANWRLPLKWNARADVFRECAGCGWRGDLVMRDDPVAFACPSCDRTDWRPARRRVFCASLADWLDNEVPIEWLVDLLDLIRRTPNLDWLMLTKRIGNWRSRLEQALEEVDHELGGASEGYALYEWIRAWLEGTPPANVWLGITICNQHEANRDAIKLLRVSALIRFLSIEPMLSDIRLWKLGALDFEEDSCGAEVYALSGTRAIPDCDWKGTKIDWVICGGESGPHARPMHPDWARSLRDQCARAGVPFLFKQWGEWCPVGGESGKNYSGPLLGPSRVHWVWPDGQHEQVGGGRVGTLTNRYGKKAAGRTLDGVEHNGFPKVAP